MYHVPMDNKATLRDSTSGARNSIDGHYREMAEATIRGKIIQSPEIITASTIATYVSYQSEVDTHQLITHWLSERKRVVVPKVIDNNLSFFEINQMSDVVPGYRGILEPTNVSTITNPMEIDVCIVPGLAFDINGYRLGYGKGFYDRFLASYPHISIGICFTNQLFYEIPHTKADIPVRCIITDTVTIEVSYQPLHI